MKRIYVSQRVDIVPDYAERRDSLDQRWAPFLRRTGAIPFPLPNDPQSVSDILKKAPPDGILLTGGNSPVKYGGSAPERDAVDALLLDYVMEHEIPLIGVCRGMQSILLYFGGSLRDIEGHIAARHIINGYANRTVNSYHSLAADTIPSSLVILACSEDAVTEAVRHSSLPILAVMWHPEREEVYVKDDIEMFEKHWSRKGV